MPKDNKDYEEFLQEADLEKATRDKVLKRGVVHEIHLAEDAEGIVDLSNYYTKSEVDALLAALGILPACVSSPIRHDFLMYDEINECWKNQLLDMDFEDTIDYTVTNMWMALIALIRIEDDLGGDGLIVEDAL